MRLFRSEEYLSMVPWEFGEFYMFLGTYNREHRVLFTFLAVVVFFISQYPVWLQRKFQTNGGAAVE